MKLDVIVVVEYPRLKKSDHILTVLKMPVKTSALTKEIGSHLQCFAGEYMSTPTQKSWKQLLFILNFNKDCGETRIIAIG